MGASPLAFRAQQNSRTYFTALAKVCCFDLVNANTASVGHRPYYGLAVVPIKGPRS